MNFYEKFSLLCKQNKIAETQACLNMGLSRSTRVRWKNGSVPDGRTMVRVCEYFHVSTAYFSENADADKEITDPNLREVQHWLSNANEEQTKKLHDLILLMMPEITQ